MVANEAWEYLSNYESYTLVKQDYFGRHGRSPNTQAAREISAPFVHARSYFTSASNADPTVKPLLLYYGVVSLSRALTLLLSRGLRESTLAPSHGLRVISWLGELSKERFDVADLKIGVTEAGSFRDLARATKQVSLVRANQSSINYIALNDDIATGMEYSLGDILSRIPELSDQHFRWRGVRDCFRGTFHTDPESNTAIFGILKSSVIDRQQTDRLLNNCELGFTDETPSSAHYSGRNSVEALPAMTDKAGHLGIGDLYISSRYPGSSSLSKTSAAFALSYILGMLVRYYPTQWTALIKSQVSDDAVPTLMSSIDYIETRFPGFVKDFIEYRGW